MPLTFEYNNLKSLLIHNSGVAKLGHTEEHAVPTKDCALQMKLY